MLDKYTMPRIDTAFKPIAEVLLKRGVRADQVTLVGFLFGLVGLVCIVMSWFWLAIICLVFNRVADGLDGALARLLGPTKAGGYLDICLDFVFYAAFVLAFAIYDIQANALAAAVLLTAYMATASAFLAFAAAAEAGTRSDLPHKSFYYLEGLAEGTETVVFMLLALLFPLYFATLAYAYAAVCSLTAITRIIGGYRALR